MSAPGLRVGVSGHRAPPKLPEASKAPLRTHLDRLFAAMAATAREAAKNAAAPAVVSSLAEGADRIVAKAGLAAGFALDVVMPFRRDEYAKDFETPASRREFDELLVRAAAVVELAGAADDRPAAYEAAGLAMLAKINVLIAIWDGEAAAGIGGTAEIVSRAIADGTLVLWIEPKQPNALRISRPAAAGAPPARANANANADPRDGFQAADVATVARAVEAILTRAMR